MSRHDQASDCNERIDQYERDHSVDCGHGSPVATHKDRCRRDFCKWHFTGHHINWLLLKRFSMNRKIVPIHLAPVAILSRSEDLSKISGILLHKESLEALRRVTTQVSRQSAIPAEMESPVIVGTSQNGLRTIALTQTNQPVERMLRNNGKYELRQKLIA